MLNLKFQKISGNFITGHGGRKLFILDIRRMKGEIIEVRKRLFERINDATLYS